MMPSRFLCEDSTVKPFFNGENYYLKSLMTANYYLTAKKLLSNVVNDDSHIDGHRQEFIQRKLDTPEHKSSLISMNNWISMVVVYRKYSYSVLYRSHIDIKV